MHGYHGLLSNRQIFPMHSKPARYLCAYKVGRSVNTGNVLFYLNALNISKDTVVRNADPAGPQCSPKFKR